MAKLQLILDGKTLLDYPMTQKRISIGRRRHCDIWLDHPAVSGDHALIERVGDDWYLEDRASTNGTKINGRPAKRQRLRPGDEIGIARYILRCIRDEAAQFVPSSDPTLMVVRSDLGGGKVNTRVQREAPKPAESGELAVPVGGLRILSGPKAGKEISLAKPTTTLGKAGFQVLAISRQLQGYSLELREGDALPRVNGQSTGSCLLKDGDEVEFLGVRMTFSCRFLR